MRPRIHIGKEGWLSIFLILSLLSVIFLVERMIFLAQSEDCQGTVLSVEAENSRCGGKHRYSCTKYSAQVQYTTQAGRQYVTELEAGSQRGYNAGLQHAAYAVGNKLPMVYDPEEPTRAYEKSVIGILGSLLFLFILNIGSFVGVLGARSEGGVEFE